MKPSTQVEWAQRDALRRAKAKVRYAQDKPNHMVFPAGTFSVSDPVYVARPASVELPTLAFDQLIGCTEAEMKVALFIIRQTSGYGRAAATLTYNQIAIGIIGEDGRLLDRGTGLCTKSIGRALRLLLDKGFIQTRGTNKPRQRNTSVAPDIAAPTGTAITYSLGQRLRPVRNWIEQPLPKPVPEARYGVKTPRAA